MRSAILVTAALAASTLLAACGAGSASTLTGTTWQLTAITEKVPAFQGVVPEADQSKYTILFNTDGTFNATADCNTVAGTYKTSGSNVLTITPGPSTLVFCGEGSMGDLFVHALSTAATYVIKDGALTITQSNEGTLAFAAAKSKAAGAAATVPPAPAQPSAGTSTGAPSGLLGRTWNLTETLQQQPVWQGVVPPAEVGNYTITFAQDGTFSAKADCNSVFGTYKAADPTAPMGDLAINPAGSTMAMCPEGSLSDLYVIGLSYAVSYKTDTDTLTITTYQNGQGIFKAAAK